MSEAFSIALIGQAAFGESVLEKLLEQGETIAGVFCPPDVEGRNPDPIKETAQANGVPVFQFARMRSAEAIAAFRSLNAELGVMAFVTDIVPMEILTAPKQGTIQYHPSLLPKYRGPSSINWPIIQGETTTGLSIFWPDDGLDTGPILMQKEVTIGHDDTLGTIYFGNLFQMGVDAMAESVLLVKAGTAPKIEQDESAMTYQGWCKAEDACIDWGASIEDLYNLVRGTDPSPGANTTMAGAMIQFFDASRLTDTHESTPGTIIAISEDGLRIAVDGGTLLVRRVKPSGGKKKDAFDWSKDNAIEVGQRFGT